MRDLFTGKARSLSGSADRLIDVTIRHDIPKTDGAHAGLRGATPLALRESRDRRIGAIFAFSVRGNF